MKEVLDVRSLFPEIDRIGDAAIRDAIVAIWEQLWSESAWDHLDDVPVSLKIPYPQRKHTQGVLRVALAATPIWEDLYGQPINRDVLIAGAMLMDVSKLVESQPGDGGPARTAIGRHLPHAMYTAHLALAHGIPLEVVHIITAHSPNGGKAPATIECQILDWIDQADISAAGFEIWSRRVDHFQP
jgi:hypothetical protein